MGFTSGAKTLPDLIDDIANGLIASSVNWVEGDSTWNITDTTNNNARRVVRYTGDSADIWFSLECVNQTGIRISTADADTYAKGLRITIAASWDSINHTWGETNQQSFVYFEGEYADSSPNADLGILQLSYYMWIDSTGFVVMARPESWPDDARQASFIVVLEHMASKEYSDGLTNFYCYCNVNANWCNGGYSHADFKLNKYMRPFSFMSGYSVDSGMQWWNGGKHAFKSNGNGKVYYTKPLVCNTADERTPIYQSELFFLFSTDRGLVDGDVVAVDGQTTKYLCKSISSPNSTSLLNYAIKYVA
ncbi:hypothetical protein [Methanolobus halotolerans]|uniref:Uncharacterized protein n=1 Tax=Methanolobus halotolerans TaxID=2052935 RepID=A0A4E0PTY9_9EURY|nr:hypothetical protein [Methanolobus halotolerans]TGC08136.1 hypothetical protein CUN85_09950 [Methanolobus halotolerans]